ncbi:nucleotidyltransferase domain-containing protein (plasmid) [Skermanella mucosa]|uniref:nucleotidyltransferase family protein n=1 Tax=Skermanella mucosa TaxID=1789672 RepID=UPI00192BDD9F|nr:nucleotidyltransferase domain-containing protein [Skermanella mucosa]UEM24911.1 nucleotidyltransferase domain-containing protein [Skermanella mucosa]
MATVIDGIDVSSRPTLRSVAETIRANGDRLHDAGIGRIVVFGSVVRGEDSEDSDIDVLITPLPSVIVSGLRLAGWRNLLTEMLGREADAVADEFLRDAVRTSAEAEGVEVFRAVRGACCKSAETARRLAAFRETTGDRTTGAVADLLAESRRNRMDRLAGFAGVM